MRQIRKKSIGSGEWAAEQADMSKKFCSEQSSASDLEGCVP